MVFMTVFLIFRTVAIAGKIRMYLHEEAIFMCEQEIINRIRELCDARGWTIYRLAKSCDITYSTLCTMLHKGTAPSIPTLVKLCQGFGITLSDFFDSTSANTKLSADEKSFLQIWDSLTPENQTATRKFAEYLALTQKNYRQ